MNSPRSTRGTTLKTAYSNGLPTSLLQGFEPPARFLEAARQELHVGGAYRCVISESVLVPQPLLGHEVHDLAQDPARELGSQPGVSVEDIPGKGQQDVVAGGERPLARSSPISPGVVEVQRGSVVYEPQAPVPREEVRVARGAIHVRHEGIEPQDAGGEIRRGRLHEGVEAQRARQVVERQVQPGARPDEVLYLRVGLGAGELRVEAHEHDIRHEQTQSARDLTRYYLRYER